MVYLFFILNIVLLSESKGGESGHTKNTIKWNRICDEEIWKNVKRSNHVRENEMWRRNFLSFFSSKNLFFYFLCWHFNILSSSPPLLSFSTMILLCLLFLTFRLHLSSWLVIKIHEKELQEFSRRKNQFFTLLVFVSDVKNLVLSFSFLFDFGTKILFLIIWVTDSRR